MPPRYAIKAESLHETDLDDEFRESNSATYCPEDNKLRVYLSRRVDRQSYDYLRKVGYVATPKQECSFAAPWSIDAEDAAFDLIAEADDIGDEDTSPAERAAQRAERFAGYRDKRRSEAHGLADRFDSGPSAVGFQSQTRADRAARRLDRVRDRSLCQWSKAEYWQTRTAGVISHALHRSSAHVRRGRILEIEKELRGAETGLEESRKRWRLWKKVSEITDPAQATAIALRLAGSSSSWEEYQHPRKDRKSSLWSLLDDREDPITGHEAAAMYLARRHPEGPGEPGSRIVRAIDHLKHRLEYENAMLENEGGKAADAEMVVGGWINGHRIHKINKSPITGRVVSVGVYSAHPWIRNEDGTPSMRVRVYNVERLGENAYRAPTAEELASFKPHKEEKPKAPPLVNPTAEDAQRLQDHWNNIGREKWERYWSSQTKWDGSPRTAPEWKNATVWEMTQAQYSERSRNNGPCSTIEIELGGQSLKVRKGFPGHLNGFTADPYRVVRITDKPEKALPVDFAAPKPQPQPEPEAVQVAEVSASAPVVTAEKPARTAPSGMLF